MATIEKRTTRNGYTHYRVMVRLKGAPPEYRTFHSRYGAGRWAAEVENRIRRERDAQAIRSARGRPVSAQVLWKAMRIVRDAGYRVSWPRVKTKDALPARSPDRRTTYQDRPGKTMRTAQGRRRP